MQALARRQFEELERDHWWFRGRRAVYLGLLRAELGGARPRRALDLGSGPGGFLPGLAALCEELHHVDLAPDALAACARRGFGRGAAADAARLPYRDGSFELACAFDVLEHCDDDLSVLRELARVLAPGGRLLVTVPAHPLLYANNDRVAEHRRRYTRRGLARSCAAAGLRVVRNTGANALLFPLIAGAVLGLKAWERAGLAPRGAQHTNLSLPLPRAAHALLYGAFRAELPLARRFDLPLGHSIALLARRP